MKIIFIAVLFYAFAPIIEYIPQKKTKEYLPYCQLKWSDFIIHPSNDKTAALSSTNIDYVYDGDNKVVVSCSFFKPESYVISTARTAYILNHEQRHFDITFIFKIKFVRALQLQETINLQIVDSIYKKIVQQKEQEQAQYDFETNHSEYIPNQKIWDQQIDALLTDIKTIR
jgi:hypothetical protein